MKKQYHYIIFDNPMRACADFYARTANLSLKKILKHTDVQKPNTFYHIAIFKDNLFFKDFSFSTDSIGEPF